MAYVPLVTLRPARDNLDFCCRLLGTSMLVNGSTPENLHTPGCWSGSKKAARVGGGYREILTDENGCSSVFVEAGPDHLGLEP